MAEAGWRTEDLSPSATAWAMGDEGRRWLDELVEEDGDDELARATRLREAGLAVDHAATLQGIAGASRRARAAGQPAHTWWTPAAAEQASHPEVAAWRSRRFTDAPTVDLTAGCGADALALTAEAGELVALEWSATRVPLLRANLASTVAVVRADATRPPVHREAWWGWADPGRRVDGRRVRGLGATSPAVPELVSGGWAGLGVAVSPAVDLADPDRPADAELEFVQVGRQLVEGTFWLGTTRDTGPGARAGTSATLLPAGVHVRGDPTPPDGPVVEVGAWLAEPAPALVRARLVDTVAAGQGLARVARRRALFTGPAPTDSPWFRCEQVEAVVPARPGRVRDVLAALDPQPLEIVVHGLEADLRRWWRGLGHPQRGPRGRAVHLVRLDDRGVAVLTRRQ